MTDIVEFTRQSPLLAALARPKVIAVGCVVALAGLGWATLAMVAASTDSGGSLWAVLCSPNGTTSGGVDLILAFLMWGSMVLAMMLPTAGPMVLSYADIAETAARKGEPIVSPLTLSAGYVAIWLGFALLATAGQAVITRVTSADPAVNALSSGALFLAAGLYQFSALKHACLAKCQRPFAFFFANWTTRPRGVFALGLRQGLYCLGCCWAMMLLMFAVGAMNIVWMAVLGIVMAVEKMTTSARFSYAVGMTLIAIGVAFLAFARLSDVIIRASG